LLDLPAPTHSLRVALVYNQKKEDPSQLNADEACEPPSINGVAASPSSHQTQQHETLAPVQDLYAEWDTFETIDAVRSALAINNDVTLVEADLDCYSRLRELRPEIVFNIAEGLHGVSREAQIPAMLELLRIPYSGSDPLTLAVCLDKSRTKEILSYYKIPTPRFQVVASPAAAQGVNLRFPVIVKPLHEGSSKGIFNSSLVSSKADLQKEVENVRSRYNQPALVEEFLAGREFTVAMLGNGENVKVLPIVEILFDSLPSDVNRIYSYEAKWIWDRSDSPLEIFRCPAQVSDTLKNEIEAVCRKTYSVLRCRDWCRIDIRLDAHNIPHVLELNPLPGILPKPEDNSCFPKAARAVGLSYDELMQTVLTLAAVRNGLA
jgi:D-alanine-D-alanine ligase